jgi:hypothetical protein
MLLDQIIMQTRVRVAEVSYGHPRELRDFDFSTQL